MPSGTANFAGPDEAGSSLLAQAVFETEGVVGVFLGSDFITVTKSENDEWDLMKPLILGAIMGHFQFRDIWNYPIGLRTDRHARGILHLEWESLQGKSTVRS